MSVSDVDGNGTGDIIVTNRYSSTVSILINNGNGTFAVKADFSTGEYPLGVFVNGLDGIGFPYLAIVNEDDSSVLILN